MLLAESGINRPLAICLSACLVWSFFACVWMCSHHSEDASENRAGYQTATWVISGDCYSCPIEDARVVIPHRPTTIDPSSDAANRTVLLDFQQAGDWLTTASLSHLPLSTADPPLERLCAYRI